MQSNTPCRIPKYRLHKTSGRAVVRLEGRDIYLGKHGTDESKQEYHRVISEWLVSKKSGASTDLSQKTDSLTINELILGYLDHARTYYVKNGQPTRETENVKESLRELCQLYGHTPVDDLRYGKDTAFDHVAYRTNRWNCCEAAIYSRFHRLPTRFAN